MSLRDSVLVQRQTIGHADLQALSSYVREAPKHDSLVSNFDEDPQNDQVEWVLNRKVRDTQEVELAESVVATLHGVIESFVLPFVNRFYAIEVRDWEPAHILHYGTGGHYIPHVDAETLYKDDVERDYWEKTLDRDLSVVCFINDDFVGGELVFPDLPLKIEPEAGTLVCFPSDHHFVHGVVPVQSGHRYTIVTWLRVKGMPTPEEINRATMNEFNRRWPEPIAQPPLLAKGEGLRRR